VILCLIEPGPPVRLPSSRLFSVSLAMAPTLRLYTRVGCCLCEGLQERLEALQPPPRLELVDVDTDPQLQARYGLSVPVLALPATAELPERQLPPLSPRLSGEGLRCWLRAQGGL